MRRESSCSIAFNLKIDKVSRLLELLLMLRLLSIWVSLIFVIVDHWIFHHHLRGWVIGLKVTTLRPNSLRADILWMEIYLILLLVLKKSVVLSRMRQNLSWSNLLMLILWTSLLLFPWRIFRIRFGNHHSKLMLLKRSRIIWCRCIPWLRWCMKSNLWLILCRTFYPRRVPLSS